MRFATEYRIYRNKKGLVIQLPNKIFESIQKQVDEYYPKECGGIFVGRVKEEIATIEQIMMPNKFSSSPVLFRRMATFLNRRLNEVFKLSAGETIYLGEWHSHPNARPFPSNTDHTAMKNISNSEGVRIKTPLMMIVGYDKKEYNETFYLYDNGELTAYEKE